MAHFLYKAKKGPKEIVEGSVEADSENAAIKRLTQDGLYLVWIEEKKDFSKEKTKGVLLFSKRIKPKDLANFTRQLSDLLDSGLTLFDSLNVIEKQIGHPQLKEVIRSIRDSIKDGNTFSESLTIYPHIFSSLYISLVKAGEAGSMLSEVMVNIADFLEKQEDVKSKVIAALLYPMLMVFVGIGTIFILMAFVIPKLANMFIEMGEVLPLPTRILIGISDFASSYWILLVILAGGVVFFIKKGSSNKGTKKTIDRFKLKLPVVGGLIKNSDLARFSRTLSTLLKNGVPILYSLKITSDIIDNEIVKEEVLRVYTDVKAGSSLKAAIKKNTSFPQFVVNMTAIGEEGGFLDKMLLKVAKAYEVEIDRAVKAVSALLEPVLILAMGLIVGFIVIAMLLPVFEISITAQ
ncbi:MAG: type II secretion system F family protein [Candidatus Omnitrophica bacterium]|nr:type II secretion system F family protein [Candidatus Omnitrophota bacterium]MBU4589330.1 type II secretion system F family protein [Candidatus Omnitrophota bacterium]